LGRSLGLDIGSVRTGVAVSDELNMIATPHSTIETKALLVNLEALVHDLNIEVIVIGDPLNLRGGDSDNTALTKSIAQKISNKFKNVNIVMQDERFTSKLASRSLVEGGTKKSKRRVKGELDKVSAALILQDYLNS
jgi:putative Holliday junction resolvase